jgi:hypothetical protein
MSKQMNIMNARCLDAREKDNGMFTSLTPGIISLSVHPGMVDSDFLSNLSYVIRMLITPIHKLFARNTVEGAATALFAALAPEVESDEVYHGAYLSETGKITAPCVQAQDMIECEKLWASTEKSLDL